MKPSLILASSSPQRKTLLESIELPFEVIPSRVDEEAHPEWAPQQRSAQLARLKAEDVAARHPGRWVIGCDTLVVAPDGTLLEKPADAVEARTMLARQAGGASVVHSGTCVISPEGKAYEGMSSSSVTFRTMGPDEMDWWIGTGLWEGRSGGFQIDGLGQLMIERIEGDWTGVVGLPVYLLGQLLKEAGYPLYQ
jgi:septum formation protein